VPACSQTLRLALSLSLFSLSCRAGYRELCSDPDHGRLPAGCCEVAAVSLWAGAAQVQTHPAEVCRAL